jgi:hypothetical protein
VVTFVQLILEALCTAVVSLGQRRSVLMTRESLSGVTLVYLWRLIFFQDERLSVCYMGGEIRLVTQKCTNKIVILLVRS